MAHRKGSEITRFNYKPLSIIQFNASKYIPVERKELTKKFHPPLEINLDVLI